MHAPHRDTDEPDELDALPGHEGRDEPWNAGVHAAAGVDPADRRRPDLIAGRRPRLQRLITVVALGAVLAVCGVLVYLTDRDGTQALHVGGWGPTGAGLGRWASRWWPTDFRR